MTEGRLWAESANDLGKPELAAQLPSKRHGLQRTVSLRCNFEEFGDGAKICSNPRQRRSRLFQSNGYCASLEDAARQRLKTRLAETLPTDTDGMTLLAARAWAVRGMR